MADMPMWFSNLMGFKKSLRDGMRVIIKDVDLGLLIL